MMPILVQFVGSPLISIAFLTH
ncbi:hypothetical protein MED222_05550 [Vibrio sp. MED222]|nr:hypothetical protein MED222_05550 [Vibrio sp. MED222]